MKARLKTDRPAHHLNARIEAEIPKLRRYALALTREQLAVDDLVQNCIARALSKLHLWRDGTNLRAWLFAIMRNAHIDEVRRATREGIRVQIYDGEPSLSAPEEQGKRLELRDLYRALRLIPNDQRTAVLLAGLDGLSYEAAAHVMGVPVATIRTRISRGRAALRRLTEVGKGCAPPL